MAAGGVGYVTHGAGLVAIPLDGEWIAATAPTMGEAFELALASDGLGVDEGGRMAAPHLTLDDAIEELSVWATGHMTSVVGRQAAAA